MSGDRDDLINLKAALRVAPAAAEDAKARAMALAMENFDRLQGSTDGSRSNQDRPQNAGFLNGVFAMLKSLSARPALAGTASIAALIVGVAVILPVLPTGVAPMMPKTTEAETPADLPEVLPSLDDVSSSPESAPEPGVVAQTAPDIPEPAPVVTDNALNALPEAEFMAEEADTRTRKEAPEGIIAGAPLAATADGIVGRVAPAETAPQVIEKKEEFYNAPTNPVKLTAEEPVSTFSTDIDTASYALVRQTLNSGMLPSSEQVRVEEMLNYFPYAYPLPEPGQAFRTTVSVMPTPWNDGTRLVTIGLQGAMPAVADRPALNLVFLIDTSGSMDDPAKLGLLRQSLALMLPSLRPEDQISIVTYAGSAGLALPPTPASDSAKILSSLDNLTAGGSTAGAEGLELAYQTAKEMQGDGEVSRILLATDGDFNVGVSDPEGLTAYVAKKREQDGTYLSVLGFGRGNLDDATMQALAQNGNGQAAYIDTLSEARKVLVDQLTGALFTIADDVKIQVEWNPAQVAEYRLIGYETRALNREDFNNDKVDAGEIGAGLQVTAIYEVTAPGSDALLNDPLRYGTATAANTSEDLGFLRLRWKAPGEDDSTLMETPITGQEPATDEARFAASIAGFGQILQDSTYLGDWGWDQAIALALSARGTDDYGYRVEAVTLMRLAQSLDR